MSLQPDDISLLHEAIKDRQKFPRSCAKALQRVESADVNTTERIFLDHGGVPAWAAYMLTKRRAESIGHVSGKGELQRLLGRLEELPLAERRASAVQLAAAVEDKARIEQVIQTACQNAKRAPRRRDRNSRSAPADIEKVPEINDNNAAVQNHVDSCDTLVASRPPSTLASSRDSYPGGSRSHHDGVLSQPAGQMSPLGSPGEDDEHTFVDASIAACNRLFPEYLARSIKRTPRTDSAASAAVSITFSADDDSRALLSIEVVPSKTEHIAWELFGVRLENQAGFRYARVGSARVAPRPDFDLQCCRIDSIAAMFGGYLADAICANPAYQQERLSEDDCTDCVEMVVPVASDECAKISISLHLREGTKLRDELFPS